MIRLLRWVALACIGMACQKQESIKKSYIDLDSLVTAQVAVLNRLSPSLQKEATINGKNADTTYSPDSLSWANELDVFRHLDLINRPIYRGAYEVRCGEKDTQSNLLVCRMEGNERLPIVYLRYFYLEDRSQLKKITALHQESNGLYFMNRYLEMNFDDVNGNPLLTAFRIKGKQKMTLRDSTLYSIEAKIRINK